MIYRRLEGDEVPESWRGRISGLTYRFGGTFSQSGMKMNMYVSTHNAYRTTYNVIAYIEGAVEPGELVCWSAM